MKSLVQIIIASHLACVTIFTKCLQCDAIAIPVFFHRILIIVNVLNFRKSFICFLFWVENKRKSVNLFFNCFQKDKLN